MRKVSSAIMYSSLVGIMMIFTAELSAEISRSEAALTILLLVEDDAERLQAGKDHAAHLLAVLADACGKHDGVDAAMTAM